MITKDLQFSIQQATLQNDEVIVIIENNVELPAVCYLFNSKGVKVDSKNYDVSHEEYIIFTVPTSKMKYSIQCSIFDRKNKSMKLDLCIISDSHGFNRDYRSVDFSS